MPMQIVGKLNPHGEETYTILQVAGILNIDQSNLYKWMTEAQHQAQMRMGKQKPIVVLSHSLVLKLLDAMDTKEWKDTKGSKKNKLVVDIFKNAAMKPKNPQLESSAEEIKKLAEKLISMIGKD